MQGNHEHFMQAALSLAERGLRASGASPLIGVVLVHSGKIIAQAFASGPNSQNPLLSALQLVPDKALLRSTVLYQTSDVDPALVAEYGIKQIVLPTKTPCPWEKAQNFESLRQTGADCVVGVLEAEARWLNRKLSCFHSEHRPYVLLKWAQTEDRFLARDDYSSKWISGTESRALVHAWRAEYQAILVGRRTALVDNPMLTARVSVSEDQSGSTEEISVQQPLRVVLDPHGEVPPTHELFSSDAPTLILLDRLSRSEVPAPAESEQIDYSKPLPPQVLRILRKRGLTSLLVEGGAHTHSRFIEAGLWDEARIFTAPQIFGSGVPAPQIAGRLIRSQKVAQDTLEILVNEKNAYAP